MELVERLRELFALRRNILVLTFSEIVSNTGWNMHGVVWQPYILSLGATMPILGILISFQTLLRSGLLLVTGRVSDCVGRKRLMMAASILSIIGMALSILAGNWVLVLPTILLWGIAGAFWEPAFRSMIAESVEEEKRGTAFSLMSLTWFLPGFYAPAVAGFLGEIQGTRFVLTIQLFLEVSSFVTISVLVRETLKKRKKFDRKSLSSIKEVVRPRLDLSKFYAVSIINRFSMAIGEGIFFGMLMKTFGFTLIQLGILSNVFSAVVSSSQLFMGRLVDQHGRKRFLILSSGIMTLGFGGYIISRSFSSFLFFHGLFGLGMSMWNPAHSAYLSNAVPDEERGRFFGDISGLMALASFPAPILGALLYENYGFQTTVLASMTFSLISFLTLTMIRER